MFKNPDEFSQAVIERKRLKPDDTYIEIMVEMQDVYDLEEKQVAKLINPFLMSCIECEVTELRMIRVEHETMF